MKKEKIFFPNLDGLRFFCFFAVFLFHSYVTLTNDILPISTLESPLYGFIKRLVENGNLGVNFFFVLSGYLITYLLIKEKELNGKIDVKSFYIRRILRIWPLYYVVLLFGFFIFPILARMMGKSFHETADFWHYFFLLTNFDFIKGPPNASTLGILWSVAIEEQFYLLWPVILTLIPVRYYRRVFAGIIVISLLFRLTHNIPPEYEFHTLSVISDMAVGGWAAYLTGRPTSFLKRIQKLNKIHILFIYLACVLALLFRQVLFNLPIIKIFERLIIAMIFALIILEQNFSSGSFFKMGKFKRVTSWGKITYGLYCLHYICLLSVGYLLKFLGWNHHLWQAITLLPVAALLLSIGVSSLSFKYFEKPFLKLKDRFSYIITHK